MLLLMLHTIYSELLENAAADARAESRRLADRADQEHLDRQADERARTEGRRTAEREHRDRRRADPAPSQHRQYAPVVDVQSSYKARRGSIQDQGLGALALGARRGSAATEQGHSRAADRLRAMTDAKRHV